MKIRINKEFIKDLYIWLFAIYILIFIVCVWFSACHFLIETLNLPTLPSCLGNTGEALLFGTLYLICIFFIILIIQTIKIMLNKTFNYIFVIEK